MSDTHDEEVLLMKHIDRMSYYDLLSRWRFAMAGDHMLQGAVGDYFAKRIKEKRDQLSADEQVNTSKEVGWEK